MDEQTRLNLIVIIDNLIYDLEQDKKRILNKLEKLKGEL
jgi:hypothetical protein